MRKVPLDSENEACRESIPASSKGTLQLNFLPLPGPGSRYRLTGTRIICQAGVLVPVLRVTGLDLGLVQALGRWRAAHHPGKIIAGLVVGVARGGDCLSRYRDAAGTAGASQRGRLRPGSAPAGQRAGPGCAVDAEGDPRGAGPRPGSGPGRRPVTRLRADGGLVTLDLDATLVTAGLRRSTPRRRGRKPAVGPLCGTSSLHPAAVPSGPRCQPSPNPETGRRDGGQTKVAVMPIEGPIMITSRAIGPGVPSSASMAGCSHCCCKQLQPRCL